AYSVHPYKWATIGKEISHIENATMDDVKSFFFRYYRPDNAVLVVAGNVTFNQVRELSKKWFGDIEAGGMRKAKLPAEPEQLKEKILETSSKVPLDAIYKVYHMPGRYETGFREVDLLSDVLGRSKSSRLYQ